MKSLKISLSFFLFLVLSGCDSDEVWRDGPYHVSWIDTSPLHFACSEEYEAYQYKLIDIVAIGSNDKYVLVKLKNGSHYLVLKGDNNCLTIDKRITGPHGVKDLGSRKDIPTISEKF